MTQRQLGRTDLSFEPLVFGCNVLGWTLEENDAYRVLDAFLAEGFAAVDTADVYGRGKSETILGNWMKSRGNRDRVLVFTKVGSDMGQGKRDLSARWIEEEVEHSLRRLRTDRIDLYQSHWPDTSVPQEETLGAYDRLVKAGKVRWIGASNHSAEMHAEADEISAARGWPRYESEQPEYNLYARSSYEGPLQQYCVQHQVGVIPYFSLAAGFLTGKYRSEADFGKSPRGGRMGRYLDARGKRILAAMDKVAAETGASLAEIAIAWLNAQPGITAPIASATSVEQLQGIVRGARLSLSAEQLQALTEAGKEG
ncbi:MAG TPA: aldo/keto reductase [Devosiaceae bacterium]|jgi:aryl-alcohol dehydrogenase-like predicted oxidoreductase|nr:aldo/keto reductase [Devosiaceae bacterium]